MIVFVAMDLFAVGGDDIDPDDAFAGRAVDSAVPAIAALQQVAAEANALAVAAGEEQALLLQVGHEQTAARARAGDGKVLLGVDRGVIEAADVEQHGSVAEMARREAVSTRDDADMVAIGLGIAQARDDVVGVDGLHDQLGIALGHP